MSYLVIARKWRPQTFEEVVGQPHATRTLQNAIRSSRIAHSYLFTGARGVGKTSIARILAKALNCETGVTPTPCNVCSNCTEIRQGNAVDVLEIDGASNRGIDSVRELRETVRYRPAKSRYKVYIIDEVHMLTTEAFNALLKTLEEPPEHVVFIFATTEPHKIPATILSRCQRFDFRRIPSHMLVDHLRHIAAQEDVALSEGVLYAIAREADGSMRDAQSLLEQMLSFSRDGLSDEEVLDVLGVIDRRSVHRTGTAVLEGDVRTCLDVVEDIYRRGMDIRRFCRQLCDYFRNLLVVAFGEGDSRRLDLPSDEKQLLAEAAGKTTPESLYLYFQTVLKSEEEIRRSTIPRIALEMLLLRLARLPRLESLQGVLDKISALEQGLKGATTGGGGNSAAVRDTRPPGREGTRAPDSTPPARAARPPMRETPRQGPGLRTRARAPGVMHPIRPCPNRSPEANPSPDLPRIEGEAVPLEDLSGRWPAFLKWLELKEPILAAKLARSRIASAAADSVELEVVEVFEEQLREPQTVARIGDAAEAFFRRRCAWTIRKKPEGTGRGDTQREKKKKALSKRLVMEHPVVLQALEILGGELVDIRRPKTDRGEPRSSRSKAGE